MTFERKLSVFFFFAVLCAFLLKKIELELSLFLGFCRSAFIVQILISFSSVQFIELNNWIERRSIKTQFNKPVCHTSHLWPPLQKRKVMQLLSSPLYSSRSFSSSSLLSRYLVSDSDSPQITFTDCKSSLPYPKWYGYFIGLYFFKENGCLIPYRTHGC